MSIDTQQLDAWRDVQREAKALLVELDQAEGAADLYAYTQERIAAILDITDMAVLCADREVSP